METTHHVDHATACYVFSSSHEPGVRIGSVRQLDGAHATSLVLVPQLIRQLRRLGTESVGQQRFHVGSIRVRVGRLGHERVVQGDVDLTPQRMQPVVHRTYGCSRVEIVSVWLRHLHMHVYHRVGEIYVIVSGTGDEEFYRSSRVQRGRGLMLHHVTGDDAVLNGRHGKEIQLARDSLARLSMHERHCRSLSLSLSFLGRPSLASSLYCSDCRLCRRLFYTLTYGHGVYDATQQNVQSTTSLVLRTDEVGQRIADLARVRIVFHRKVNGVFVWEGRYAYVFCLYTSVIVEYVDLSSLGRPFLASSLYRSDCRLYTRLFYTFTGGRSKTRQQGIGDASLGSLFYVLNR